MTWRDGLNANEVDKIRWEIVEYTRGRGLDIGCSAIKAFPHMIGVDSGKDRMFGTHIDPDVTADAAELDFFATDSLDFVFSSHCLEHIEDYESALKEWYRVLKPQGYLVLYLPHKDFYPNIGAFGSNPDHKHDFLPADIIEAMHEIGGWDLIVNEERDGGDEYSFFQVFRKRSDAEQTEPWSEAKPAKTVAICRMGAWGDAIQMSSILPGLKDLGFHITLITTPQGLEVVKHDPLIDHVVLLETEQIPNMELGGYWSWLRKKYTKFINLSESVEAQFLAMPERVNFHWPQKARHAVMNHNYGELLHSIAGVLYEGPESRFVPTDEEASRAQAAREEMAGWPVIMWVLAGSAINKLYPHMDAALSGILKLYPGAAIVTVGNEQCRDKIEEPWKAIPQIVRRSGVWSIRETMAFAKHCDLVIGPETGVLNSVAMDSMQKIVMLSHSSVENLTRDWVNTASLYSVNTPCHPCHKMIHVWEHCVRDDSGTAACMAAIPAASVVDAVRRALPQREELAA